MKCTVALLSIGLALSGCTAAPESLVELEDQSVQSMTNYAENAGIAVAALRQWGLLGHRGWIDTLAEITVRDETVTVSIPQVDEEGNLGDPHLLETLPPATVLQILKDYRGQMDALDDQVEVFDAQWKDAGGEFVDALDMRRQVREWLTRTGVRPEHLDAVTRALEGELRRRSR